MTLVPTVSRPANQLVSLGDALIASDMENLFNEREFLAIVKDQDIIGKMANGRVFDLRPLFTAVQTRANYVSDSIRTQIRDFVSAVSSASAESLKGLQTATRRLLMQLGVPRHERTEFERVFSHSESSRDTLTRLNRFFTRHNPYMHDLVRHNRALLSIPSDGPALAFVIALSVLTFLYVALVLVHIGVNHALQNPTRFRVLATLSAIRWLSLSAIVVSLFFVLDGSDFMAAFSAGLMIFLLVVGEGVSLGALRDRWNREHPSPGAQQVEMQQIEQNIGTVHEVLPMLRASNDISEKTGKECLFCLDDLKEADQLSELPCGHKMHEECLNEILLHAARNNYNPKCLRCFLEHSFDHLKAFGAQRINTLVEVPLDE